MQPKYSGVQQVLRESSLYNSSYVLIHFKSNLSASNKTYQMKLNKIETNTIWRIAFSLSSNHKFPRIPEHCGKGKGKLCKKIQCIYNSNDMKKLSSKRINKKELNCYAFLLMP